MLMNGSGSTRIAVTVIAVAMAFLMVNSAFQQHDAISASPLPAVSPVSDSIQALADVPFLGKVVNGSSPYTGMEQIVVILNYSNESRLQSFLHNLSDPSSPQYRHFMTADQFYANFSPSAAEYDRAVAYFRSAGMVNITTFQGRNTIAMSGSSQAIRNAFHTDMVGTYENGTMVAGPSSNPRLPQWLSPQVYDIVGLGTSPQLSFSLNVEGELKQLETARADTTGGYPKVGFLSNGAEALYGTYMQVAYNETQLFGSHYDRGEVIATLLWSGNYTNSRGSIVYTAPFNPSDITQYFNYSYPKYPNGTYSEPFPTVTGVPIDNAPAPGVSAEKDTSGATIENTLDLEMAGSLAPGAQIYNIYGPQASTTDLTQAFATALNFQNLTVISNSWGGSDGTDSTWNTYLQEAQARGITVLASSGDSADNTSSPKYAGPPDMVQFPSSIGYNTFGVTAVGGTNVTINITTLKVEQQGAWYMPSPGNTVGTTGGISTVYSEPSWQINSSANSVLNGKGRGVPDISALANNTLIYYSNTTVSGLFVVSGTSVSSPVEAGIIATMDAYLNASAEAPLGFVDPLIYKLGTGQYDPAFLKESRLSRSPFFNVSYGRNSLYNVTPGYNLATGWGSINAYNFIQDSNIKRYNVSFVETGLKAGTGWSVRIVGRSFLSGTDSRYVNLSLPNGTFQYEIPHVGSMVGIPPQSSVNVSGKNVTVNIIFKYGYVVNFTQSGLPANDTWELNAWNYSRQYSGYSAELYFPNGSYNYTGMPADPNYYGQSGNFTVSGKAVNIFMKFRHGQFNVSFIEQGLPINQEWRVMAQNSTSNQTLSGTTDNITFYLYGGQYTFYLYPSGYDAPNISAVSLNTNGQNQTVYVNYSYGYFVTFRETGLSSGTLWGISFHGLTNMTTGQTLIFEVPNGTYRYDVRGSTTPNGPSSGYVNVSGSNQTVVISYQAPKSFFQTEVLYLVLLFFGIVLLVSGVSLIRRKH